MIETLPNSVKSQDSRVSCAVFDFDGTLAHKDTFLSFIRYAVGGFRYFTGMLILSPILTLYLLRVLSNSKAKQMVLSHFFKGLNQDSFRQISINFSQTKLKSKLRYEAVKRLNWHKKQGHLVVILSATLESYLLPLVDLLDIDIVIGTRLEVIDNRLTGKIEGKNCYGAEKLSRLSAKLGDLDKYIIYAYGDSKGDRDLLKAADYPYYRKFN